METDEQEVKRKHKEDGRSQGFSLGTAGELKTPFWGWSLTCWMDDFMWVKNLLGLLRNVSILVNKTFWFKENNCTHIIKQRIKHMETIICWIIIPTAFTEHFCTFYFNLKTVLFWLPCMVLQWLRLIVQNPDISALCQMRLAWLEGSLGH